MQSDFHVLLCPTFESTMLLPASRLGFGIRVFPCVTCPCGLEVTYGIIEVG